MSYDKSPSFEAASMSLHWDGADQKDVVPLNKQACVPTVWAIGRLEWSIPGGGNTMEALSS